MAEKSNISWCDSTINFWRGCTKVSPGCANCYAEALVTTRLQGEWGKGKPRQHGKGAVKDALAFNRKPWICDGCGHAHAIKPAQCNHSWQTTEHPDSVMCCTGKQFHRRRIFSLSLGDWLDDEVPIEWLAEMLYAVFRCDQVTWILCTKRPENGISALAKALKWAYFHASNFMGKVCFMDWLNDWHEGKPPKHVILLASVENQEQADIRIPQLLAIPAACHGLSLEPLLSEVNLGEWLFDPNKPIGWVIAGGESGSNARCCEVEWIRYTSIQCQETGTPFFCKQLGAASSVNGSPFELVDKKGGDPSEWPADLRVQEWPTRF